MNTLGQEDVNACLYTETHWKLQYVEKIYLKASFFFVTIARATIAFVAFAIMKCSLF